MNLILLFDDSEVARVEHIGAALRVAFSAASVVRMAERSGAAAIPGWARAVELVIHEAQADVSPNGLMGRLASGRISLAGQWAGRVPLPSELHGPVRLELAFANRTALNVSGSAMACGFRAEPNFTESLAC